MSAEIGGIHKNHTKDHFNGDDSPVITEKIARDKFPGDRRVGDVQETGLVFFRDTEFGQAITGAIRHPRLIPKSERIFGGQQRTNHIEHALTMPVGPETASETAQEILKEKKLPTSGFELEGFTHHARDAILVQAEKRIECQRGLREDPMDEPAQSPEVLAVIRAIKMHERREEESAKGKFVLDTSVPFTLGGQTAAESEGLKLSDHPYIRAMGALFDHDYFLRYGHIDPRPRIVLDDYALANNFQNIEKMQRRLGVAAVWDIAAAHVSLGTTAETENVIAVGNMFSSDLAVAADFLTQSTPIHAGKLVKIQEGAKAYTVRDIRALSRLYLRSAHVSNPFIDSPQELTERIIYGITNGMATTADRSAYFAQNPDGIKFISAHAVARLRPFGRPGKDTRRVEYVAGGSTPSVYDALARDAYLTILWTGAMEALANKKSPQEYFSEKGFTLAGTADNQKELSIRHALKGAKDEGVSTVINQNLDFLKYMYDKYPHLQDHIKFVSARLLNLKAKPTASNAMEYAENPRGSIADVLIGMKEKGATDLQILRQLDYLQMHVADKIINCQGDFGRMLKYVT